MYSHATNETPCTYRYLHVVCIHDSCVGRQQLALLQVTLLQKLMVVESSQEAGNVSFLRKNINLLSLLRSVKFGGSVLLYSNLLKNVLFISCVFVAFYKEVILVIN